MEVVAVDGSKAGSPVFLRHGAITVKSLQGEIAYGLGGAKAVRRLDEADHPEAQPDEELLASLRHRAAELAERVEHDLPRLVPANLLLGLEQRRIPVDVRQFLQAADLALAVVVPFDEVRPFAAQRPDEVDSPLV